MPAPNAPARATLADMLAAVELGAIDANTIVIPESTVADRIRAERKDAYEVGVSEAAASATAAPAKVASTLNGTPVHDCAMSGCTHGAEHGPDYVPQPDRQTVLLAPCGSRVRITNRALALAGGALYCGHGDTYAVTTRRAYTQRAK